MSTLTASQVAALNVALNEASLVGVDFDPPRRRFGATLAVLSLPEDDGPPPADPRIRLDLENVARLAVSWRRGFWDDDQAEVLPLAVDQLSTVVAGRGQHPIYGWEFFDAPEKSFARWAERLSLDVHLATHAAHTLDLFQEAEDFLEMRIWFDRLSIVRAEGDAIVAASIEDVSAAGKRWWDAMYAGDPRTRDSGIVPLSRG